MPQKLISSKSSDSTIVDTVDSRQLFRLKFIPSGEYFERSSCKYYSEQEDIAKKLSLSEVSPLVTPDPSYSGSILDMFLKTTIRTKDLSRLTWTCLKYIEEIFADWKSEEYIFQMCVEDPVEDLFLFLINLLFLESGFKLRLNETNSPDDHNVNLLVGKRNMTKWVTRITEDIRDSNLAPSRVKELECLKAMIKEEKSGTLIVSHCNVVIYDQKWSEKTEWDGVYFRVLPQAIYINILEAKAKVTARSGKASNDLLASFDKVGLKVDTLKAQISTSSVKGKGVGFSYLKANFIDLLSFEVIS